MSREALIEQIKKNETVPVAHPESGKILLFKIDTPIARAMREAAGIRH